MARFFRKTALLAKTETVYGTDAAPAGATNALLISNATIDVTYNNVDRALLRPYMGGSEQLVGTRYVKMDFEVEIAGSGTAGTAPAWGAVLRACGMAETVVPSTHVEYTPVSGAFDSATVYYNVDGVLYKALGCRGTVQLAMGEGERPVFKISMTGLDGGATATAAPAVTLTAWKIPQVVTNSNSPGIKLGGTYATGAVTGGTGYPSRGLTIDLGQQVQHVPLLGGETVEITGRETAGSMQLDLTAAQTVTFMADIAANTPTSLSFEHGTVAGGKVLIFAPAVQRINPKLTDFNGTVHLSMDLRFTPASGNDEIRIVAK